MPTISQLAPASAASDNDEMMISQSGVTRKISRSAFLAGLQSQLPTVAGTLLGNSGGGTAGPGPIAIGANLTLRGGTLSATAVPFVVGSLPTGTVPQGSDLVPVSQSGTESALTYAQFMSGLSSVSNIDVSRFVVTPSGAPSAIKVGDLAATTALTTGCTMTGSLVLSGDPLQPLHAATKQYVDITYAAALPKSGGTLTGPLALPGNPTQPLQAATKQYVDGQLTTVVSKSGGTLNGTLTLYGDPAQPLDATTRRYVDAGDAAAVLALATEVSARRAAIGSIQEAMASTESDAAAAKVAASAAQASATTALTLSTIAQTTADSALASATQVQTLANSALPATGGTMKGNLSLSTNYVYAGTDDFAAVRAQGRPTDGKPMLYVNKIGSAATDPSLVASYYYVSDTGGTGKPRLVNNFQANVVSTPVSGVWLSHFGITSSAIGGNQGGNGHLAADLQAVRDVSTPIGNTTVQTTLALPASNLTVFSLANFGQAPITGGTNAGKLISLVNATPASTVSTASTLSGGTNPALQVASTSGMVPGMFCWGPNIAAYVVATTSNTITLSTALQGTVQSGSSVNVGWTLLVKVGGHFYHLAAVSASSGAGTMTFAEPISVADGTAGKPVVAAQGGAPLWSFVAEIQDQTNCSSSAGGFAQIGELDLSGNGDDDGPNALVYNPSARVNLPQGGRCFLSFVGSKYNSTGPDFVMSTGLAFTTGLGASINSVLSPNVTYNSAIIDARRSTASSGNANAIWLADGHRLAFSTDGKASVFYDSSKSTLNVGGQARFLAPPIFPNYTVDTLPSLPFPGSKAYASNGRKVIDPVGGGTGVEVFADTTGRWISVLSGNPVQA